jgi:DNA-binding NtrC family response regulator
MVCSLRGGLRLREVVRDATRDALRLLRQHAWRGNVGELAAVLEQAVIFARGDWITSEDLDLRTPRHFPAESQAGVERDGRAHATAALNWLQHEALRMAAERGEVRRREFIARFRISRQVAWRALGGLVRLGLLRLIGRGRGARYVPLSFWLTFLEDVTEWTSALV